MWTFIVAAALAVQSDEIHPQCGRYQKIPRMGSNASRQGRGENSPAQRAGKIGDALVGVPLGTAD